MVVVSALALYSEIELAPDNIECRPHPHVTAHIVTKKSTTENRAEQ